MKKNKKTDNRYLIGIALIFILIAGVLLLRTTVSRPKKDIPVDSFYTLITPTIIPTIQDKNKFIHPLGHYNFEYPKEWDLILQKHNYAEDWYDVMLVDNNSNDPFKIYFQVNGRGGPNYDYEEVLEKNIGRKKIKIDTMYKDSKAFEAVVSFPNSDFGEKLIGLYIYLPEENQDEFMSSVEEIIASLE